MLLTEFSDVFIEQTLLLPSREGRMFKTRVGGELSKG